MTIYVAEGKYEYDGADIEFHHTYSAALRRAVAMVCAVYDDDSYWDNVDPVDVHDYHVAVYPANVDP